MGKNEGIRDNLAVQTPSESSPVKVYMLREALRELSFNLLECDDPHMNRGKIKQQYQNKQEDSISLNTQL